MAFGSSSGGDISVKIVGDASQYESTLKSAGSSTKGFSDSLKNVGTGLTLGVTAPLMAIGALALKSSSDVGGAFKEIRLKTNETGVALEGLKTSFKNVWGSVTGDAKDVADALSLIHQRTGLTGTALEGLTTTFSQLAKITETPLIDVVEQASAAMNAWSLPTATMSQSLDILYAVVGRTGIGISELTSSLTTLQPTLETLHLSFAASASMIGDFSVAGLDATSMQKVFTKVIGLSAKGNKDASTTFWEYIATVQTAKVGSAEYNEVLTDLGATMGVRFVNAVKKGVFSLKNFTGDLQAAPDSIKKAAADTMSFGDVMEIFTHKVEIGMQPLGSAINKTFLDAKPQMDAFAGGVQELGKAFDKLPDSVKKGIVLTGMFASALGPSMVAIGNAMPLFDKIAGAFAVGGTAAGGFASKIIGIPGHLLSIGAAVPKGLASTFTNAGTAAGGLLSKLKGLAAPAAAIAATGISIPKGAGLGTLIADLKASESGVTRLTGRFLGLGPATVGVGSGIAGWLGHLRNAEGATGKLSVGFGGVKTAASSIGGAVKGGASSILGMAGSVAGMVPLWAVVTGAIAVAAVGLGTAYATSSRFRSLMGELGGIASDFAGHLGTAFSKLTSGDWKGAVAELKTGLTEAWQGLTKIDWRSALSTIREQMFNGIKGGIEQAVAFIKSVDWGGIYEGLKGAFGDALDYLKGVDWGAIGQAILNSLRDIGGAIVAWAQGINWQGVGETAGRWFGQALITGIQVALAAIGSIADIIGNALSSGTAGGAATSKGTDLGTQFKTGFNSAISGFGSGLQAQLDRISINWDRIFEDFKWIALTTAQLLGVVITNAIRGAFGLSQQDIQPFVDNIGNAFTRAKPELWVTVKPEVTDFNAVMADATKAPRIATITATAITGIAELNLTAVEKKQRITDIVANAVTAVAESNLTATEKKQRIAEIYAQAQTAIANADLNNTSQQRYASIIAQAQTGAANIALSELERTRYALIVVRTVVEATASKISGGAGWVSPSGGAGYWNDNGQWIATAEGGIVQAMKSGGIISAKQGFVMHGPTLVLAGEVPGQDEAFVPLQGGKIPVELNSPTIPNYAQAITPKMLNFDDFGAPQFRAPPIETRSQEASLVSALTKALTKALQKQRGGSTYHINGIKMDEVVRELRRKERIDELMHGDYY